MAAWLPRTVAGLGAIAVVPILSIDTLGITSAVFADETVSAGLENRLTLGLLSTIGFVGMSVLWVALVQIASGGSVRPARPTVAFAVGAVATTFAFWAWLVGGYTG